MTETTCVPMYSGPAAAFAVLRHASQVEARGHLRDESIQVAEMTPLPTGVVYDYWMALILLAGNQLQLTLKVFYRSESCKNLLAVIAKDAAPAYRGKLVHDIMREFCNRTAGHAKRVLGDLGLPLGLSLPLVTRGFDEIFNRRLDAAIGADDSWQLKGALGVVTCVVELTATDAKHLQISWTPPAPGSAPGTADDGELEFL